MNHIFNWMREKVQNLSKEELGVSNKQFENNKEDYETSLTLCLFDINKVISEAELMCKPQKVIKSYLHLHPCSSVIGDCPRCRNGVLPESKFCRFCGISLEVE